jgi:hypothetical protein
MNPALADACRPTARAADRPEKMELYGRFIGSWDLEVTGYLDHGGPGLHTDYAPNY